MTRDVLKEFSRTNTSVINYKIDLAPKTNGQEGAVSDYLPSGVTISSATVALTSTDWNKDSHSIADSNTSVIVAVSGGSTIEGAGCYVDVHVVLSNGEEDDFSFLLKQTVRKSL